ncbi:MAG: LacI family DNA-binding transcriptional regulator [Treponema sp.]|jgi:hypothetical protein|nr:LacI family DNA-binding transcriptional regulator [Treponema sp.]
MADITIYGIDKEAGVSPATVSRVLTSKARVSDQKRELVEGIIGKPYCAALWIAVDALRPHR